jgi:hypothetical protein
LFLKISYYQIHATIRRRLVHCLYRHRQQGHDMIPANGLFKTAVFLNTLPAMRFSRMKHLPGVLAAVMLLAVMQFPLSSTAYAEPSDPKLSNDRCLRCHGRDNFSRKAENGEERDLHVAAEAFEHSVHGSSDCVSCHQDIIKAPHRKGIDRKVGCVRCHTELWYEAQRSGTKEENARLGEVVQQIESYMGSIHARPSMADQSRTNATCYNCHDAHYIEPIDNHVGSESRLKTPDVCGQCHAEQRDAYFTSVHGMEILSGNANAAVCNDCHTTHDIEKATADSGRLVITENCGNCHEENLESYMGTYHGKVTKLGYAETAKCYDCHGSHEVKRLDDETSMMHVNNRLETCQTCHADATEGYITFQPHGTMHHDARHGEVSPDVVRLHIHDRPAAGDLCILLAALGAVVLSRVPGSKTGQEPAAYPDR